MMIIRFFDDCKMDCTVTPTWGKCALNDSYPPVELPEDVECFVAVGGAGAGLEDTFSWGNMPNALGNWLFEFRSP